MQHAGVGLVYMEASDNNVLRCTIKPDYLIIKIRCGFFLLFLATLISHSQRKWIMFMLDEIGQKLLAFLHAFTEKMANVVAFLCYGSLLSLSFW